MQKIILDTNVIVSALISNSAPTQILHEIILARKVKLCLSDDIFDEYVAVLNRGKFDRFANFKLNADLVLNKINEIASFYKPIVKLDLISDISDNKFLELASVSSADYLVTGNTSDFIMKEFEYTTILNPREYWDMFAPKN